MKDNSKKNHILMILLLALWVFDSISVATAVEDMNPLFIIFLKTLFAIPVLAIAAKITDKSLTFPNVKDIPKFLLCSAIGNIMCYFFEYQAFRYLPLGIVYVCLGMTPLVSYIVDCIVRRNKPKMSILVVIAVSICGLAIAAESDTGNDSFIGYICCAMAVALWIIYGFALNWIGDRYKTITLTFFESIGTAIILLPLAIILRPSEPIGKEIFINIAIMGVLMNGLGYILENNTLLTLGTTVSGLYVNMLPVLISIAAFIFFKEALSVRQIIGSVIVVLSGFVGIILIGRYESVNIEKKDES